MAETSSIELNPNAAGGKEERTFDTSKKIRIGIIGCGWIAEAHMSSYLKQPDVEIVAAADIIPGKARKFIERYGLENVTYFNSDRELIDSGMCDAVSICTYNRQHAGPAIYAMNHGVHVLLEKPLCVTLDEAVEICKTEKANPGVTLSIGFQPRFDANMKMIKKIVENGDLGKIYYIQTGGGRRRGIPTPFGTSFIEDETAGIGALADIGCYSLDMVLNAIGYPKPLTVTGYKSAYFGQDPKTYPDHPEYAEKFTVDDFAAAFIRLEGDIVVDFRIAWAMNIDTCGDTIILGTKGGLRIPSTECWNGSIGGAMTLYQQIGGVATQTVIPPEHDDGNLFDRKIRSFLDAFTLGLKPPVPASQILYNQAILSGIVESAKKGEEVKIVIPEI